MTTPAGWYADPEQPGSQRYWDGTAWTEHRSPGAPVPPPAPAAPVDAGTTPAPQGYVAPPQQYAQPAPPAPRKRGKGCLIAILVVVAIIVVIIIAAVAGGNKNSSSPGSSTNPTDGGTSAAGLNTPVRDGSFEFTVSKVKCGVPTVGAAPLSQKAQGQFCLVTMTVKNIGTEAGLFDASSQKALSAAGAKFDADSTASLYANKNSETFLTKINPGNQVTGTVVFDLPKDAKIATLELHDSPFSGGVTVTP